jgi:hypothetical protein
VAPGRGDQGAGWIAQGQLLSWSPNVSTIARNRACFGRDRLPIFLWRCWIGRFTRVLAVDEAVAILHPPPRASDSRTKQIYYKRAVFSQSTGQTLQTILQAALSSKSRWGERQENPSADGRTFCFINYSGIHRHPNYGISFLGGEMLSYVKGSDQSVFDADPTAALVDLSAISPGKDKEFLEGTVYFGISGDHLTVMQSRSLRFGDLERHLNWLLTRCAKVILEENGVSLTDAVPVPDGGGSMGGVKGITLSAPLHFDAQVERVRIVPAGRAWEALKAMLGAGFDLPTDLDAEEILSSRSLRVAVELRWNRAPGEDTTNLLTQIAHNLRNVNDEVDYSIETSKGRLTREDFKLRTSVSVPWIGGRPRFDVLFPKMIEYLESLVETGRVASRDCLPHFSRYLFSVLEDISRAPHRFVKSGRTFIGFHCPRWELWLVSPRFFWGKSSVDSKS